MEKTTRSFGHSPDIKIELMCTGVRYSEALGRAAGHAMPNYYPYRFKAGEPDPTGKGIARIPYLINLPDGTMIRVLGNGDSPWHVAGDVERGYQLCDDRTGRALPMEFEPLRPWMQGKTTDGLPYAQAGVTTHSDMLVVNVAPGCEYFLHKHDGVSMRCAFCAYGAPDERTAHLGQVRGRVDIPAPTLARLKEAMAAVLTDTHVRHLYLVGGSLTDGEAEARRFLQLAQAVRQRTAARMPTSLGSGALPDEWIAEFRRQDLVEFVCFNLEVWSEPLFAKVCPGKNRYVGYERWIQALETAVGHFGPGRVYTAMVAGIELEPEHGLSADEAAATALEGAQDLCRRGIIPIYSLHWPTGGRERPDYHERLRTYFEKLSAGYQQLRARLGLRIHDDFMCHRCAYMQLECDIDRAALRPAA
ncbi:MAG: hypothetical protein JSR67_04970 [Proteobacteria bacterium]|nr:hypothetical protein [Pseudomonadota bacterium]